MNDVNPLQQKDIDYLKDGLHELKQTVRDGFVRLDTKLDSLDYYSKEEVNKEVERLEEKIKEVEGRQDKSDDNIKWIVRLVIGTVVLAVLGFIGLSKI